MSDGKYGGQRFTKAVYCNRSDRQLKFGRMKENSPIVF